MRAISSPTSSPNAPNSQKWAREDLPTELQGLSKEKLAEAIAAKRTERGALQKDLAALVEKRDAVIAAEKAKKTDGADGFDRVVEELVREQVK